MGGRGHGKTRGRLEAVPFEGMESDPGQTQGPHGKKDIPGTAGPPGQDPARRTGAAPDGDGDAEHRPPVEIPAHKGQIEGCRGRGHAGEHAAPIIEPDACRANEPQDKAHGLAAHGRHIAHIDGHGLVAHVLGREIGAPEMHVFEKKIRGDASRAGPIDHGGVVAASEQDSRVFAGEMSVHQSQKVVFRGDARHDSYRVRLGVDGVAGRDARGDFSPGLCRHEA